MAGNHEHGRISLGLICLGENVAITLPVFQLVVAVDFLTVNRRVTGDGADKMVGGVVPEQADSQPARAKAVACSEWV